MKLEIVLVALCIAVSTHASSSEDRRWKPIFPKNTQRFVVTMKSISPLNNSTSFNKPSKKPLMSRIIPKAVKIRNENFWNQVRTRPPLMKFTKFTVNPLTTVKTPTNSITFRNIHKVNETDRKYYKTDLFDKMMNAPAKDDSSEEIAERLAVTDNKVNRKIKRVKLIVSPFRKFKSQMIDRSKSIEHISKSKEITGKSHDKENPRITGFKFSSEEKEDREEFIFVKSNGNKQNAVKAMKDSDESDEVTTVVVEHETKNRRKRSINVIEEENLGTTVSGFKFTGKVAALSSNLVFRNINT